MTRACAEKVSAVVYISNILGHGTIWFDLSGVMYVIYNSARFVSEYFQVENARC